MFIKWKKQHNMKQRREWDEESGEKSQAAQDKKREMNGMAKKKRKMDRDIGEARFSKKKKQKEAKQMRASPMRGRDERKKNDEKEPRHIE